MLKYVDYDIVFQEIPDEVTLAVNISCCPNRCPGCHSPFLQEDVGERLTEEVLEKLLERYPEVTCVCFMGGDGDPMEVSRLAGQVRKKNSAVRAGWYSGRQQLPAGFPVEELDYVKLGPYVESLGSLKSPSTNQRLYRVEKCGGSSSGHQSEVRLIDITSRFWRNKL